jgi:uncharacterized protein DUF4234
MSQPSSPQHARTEPALLPSTDVQPAAASAIQPSQRIEPVAYGLQMKRRHPWGVYGLMWLTLGIYYLVWWYKIHNEMAQYDPRQQIKPVTSFLAVFIGGAIILPPFISTATAGGRISRAQRAAGLQATCSGGLGLLLYIVFGFVTVYYQSQLNRVIDQYQAAEGTRVPLYA